MGKKVAFLDLDAVAYTGASIAQKLAYKWKKLDGTEETEVFTKAALAKEWYDGQVGFGLIEAEEWERETITLHQPVEVAIKGMEAELKHWINSIKKHWEKDCEFVGFLTCSGLKNKDVGGIQNRYQYNRYTDKVNWIAKEKPVHLAACRSHLMVAHDWIKMSPKGVEADAIVVGWAERIGLDGCIGFKDKDLRQAYGTNLVEMNAKARDRKLEVTTELGSLILTRNIKNVPKIEGDGFKLMCYQTVAGDKSDGYKGILGFAEVAGFELFDPLESVEECCKALADLYSTKFPEGIKYTSWDWKEKELTWQELLTQHMRLAYHERSSKDKVTPIERWFKGENPIYQH